MASALPIALGILLVVAYPFIVYYVLQEHGPRAVAIVILAGLVPRLLMRLRRAGLRRVLSGPGLVLGMACLLALSSLLLREVGFALLAPVVMNAGLAFTFGTTLWTTEPIIERFARMQHPDLEPDEVAWCRFWTLVWTSFFVLNAVLVSILAFFAPVEWWVVYTGGVAYALMGSLFVVEYLLRKMRFGRYDDHFLDRGLRRWLGRAEA